MISKFGNEDFNLPFHFATKTFSLSEQEEAARSIEAEKMLKLLGFPDESVNGWEIIPLHTPVVSNVVSVMDGCGLKNIHVNYM